MNIKTVGVVGAGTMGNGIAQVCAAAGLDVIMQDIAERTGGQVQMLPGALYRHLQRMLEAGMIRELDRRKVGYSSDERRRYYAITAFGRRVAEAEAMRLAQLVRYARSKDLINDARVG